ncbi:MAG TPA: glycosyltransferase [Candidatus Marinimicrobia bacterium]|nr:MAG: glycosyltransferase [Candidatus Marinimicrobia bacterium CG1_02_48_14]PJA54025.1 MAG: glycosyltransferase [Candidatus Marinimicrobia bacterium CG_4_9_14_3_um_filter_48_9]HCW76725.1 glycosyltransferase [Candidatus Neomarinimicrobiota bacterium]
MRSISVIIPVLDEQESLTELYRQVSQSVQNLSNKYEIVFVDDGSTDGSVELVEKLAGQDEHVHLIQFFRNYGKAAALSEGFKYATGDIVITMDADLQDDPEEFEALIKKLDEGFDLVTGWKKVRHDPLSKRIPSKLANLVTRVMTGVNVHDMNCGLKVYRKSVVKTLDIYGGRHRYIPALAGQHKFKITELVVNHRPRQFGITKYGGSRLFHGFFDLVTILFLSRYTQQPLHLFGLIGFLSLTIGFLIDLYVIILKYGFGESFQKHMAGLLSGVLLIVVGVQFVSLGLLGELIAKSAHKNENMVKRVI